MSRMTKNETIYASSVEILRLDSANARFGTKNGFLCLEMTKGEKTESFERVFLHRAFPYELPEQYISVQGEENIEIGIIYDIADFDEATAALLRRELMRKYYCPEIVSIKSVKERYGFSYWKAKDKDGKDISFTMKDTFKNIKHIGKDEIVLIDVDGNRYAIKDVTKLSANSYRRIELYL